MRKAMRDEDEFRSHAAECQRMAEHAQSETDKKGWLRLEEVWLRKILEHAQPR
jgi:hypothetical protein